MIKLVDAEWQPVVAQILYSGLGGHGGVVTSMIQADKERRWQHALCFAGIEPLLPAYSAMCAAENITYAYIRAISRRPWLTYLPVINWLRRTKPDAVILHSLTLLPGVIPYCRASGAPLIVVEHQSNELKSHQEWFFSSLSMRLAEAIVTLTPRQEEALAERLGKRFDKNKVTLIPNGIDVETLGPAMPFAGDDATPVRIGMAARFSPTKRFDLLIDALAVLQRTTSSSWQLSLAGAGEHWDLVRASVARRGVTGVEFQGMLTGAALTDWYRSLDIYCHASDGETLSVSVLQAMASGLPVVGSDVEGISNLLVALPPLGMLVEAQTAEGFAKAICSLVNDPEAARRMGKRAASETGSRYSQLTMFQHYDHLIKRLLAEQ